MNADGRGNGSQLYRAQTFCGFDAFPSRCKTVKVVTDSGPMLFPDDDSLAANFWRRYRRSDYLFNSVMTQFDLNITSDQEWRSLDWMIQAMIAELRLIYEDDAQFIDKMEKSQSAWEAYCKGQLEMQFPTDGIDMGSSYPMVYHLAAVSLSMDRICELMQWYMGLDNSEGGYLGMGSLDYNVAIEARKASLRAEGRLPLRASDIGIASEVVYGDECLNEIEELISSPDDEDSD